MTITENGSIIRSQKTKNGKGGVIVQNYSYNRNSLINRSTMGYRYTGIRRPRVSVGRILLHFLVKVFLSDSAILAYKVSALLFGMTLVLGAVGAAESGALPVPVCFSVSLVALASACGYLYKKYGLNG